MRSVHCSVLTLLHAAWSQAALAQPAPAPSAADFRIFVRGNQIGTEEVTVARTPQGTLISGSGRLGPPVDVITNRCEARYDAQGRPSDLMFDAIVHGQYASMHTVFTGGTAATQVVQAGQQPITRTDKATPDVVLLNAFFGLYEAVALRLQAAKPGDELKAYIVGQAEASIRVKGITDERIQTPGRTIASRHGQLVLVSGAGKEQQLDLWADDTGRLLRLALPAQSFEMARADISSAASRIEVAPRAGDDQVQIPANGFALAGTVSKPSTPSLASAGRYPAVVLVGGSGATDRDEVASGIPIFAQLAGGLADAGFLVVRYDKRGVGQSGGRSDNATLQEYAEDARAAVAFLRHRKDVDPKRIAVAGHSEGGWVAMLAAAKNNDIAALLLIGTAGVTGAELVLAQQQHLLQLGKVPPAEQQAKIDLQKKIQNAVLTGTGWESIPQQYRAQADTPWFHRFLAFDPATVMPNIKQPVLIVQGDLDMQAFPAYADRLADVARRRKPPADKAVTIVHLPGVNHLLVPAKTGEPDEYAQLPDRNVSKEVLTAGVTWLQKTLPATR
jgi:pimeloyl-ACP methyl ester carboxylesterase